MSPRMSFRRRNFWMPILCGFQKSYWVRKCEPLLEKPPIFSPVTLDDMISGSSSTSAINLGAKISSKECLDSSYPIETTALNYLCIKEPQSIWPPHTSTRILVHIHWSYFEPLLNYIIWCCFKRSVIWSKGDINEAKEICLVCTSLHCWSHSVSDKSLYNYEMPSW